MAHIIKNFKSQKKVFSHFLGIVFVGLLFCVNSFAQRFDGVRIGIKSGAIYSGIHNLETTILSEPFFINYSLKRKQKFGFTGGVGVIWEIKNSKTALNLDVLYAQNGSDLLFTNSEKNFNYTIQFNYRYINIPLLIKIYPFEKSNHGLHGLNAGFGPQLGINLSPENILYTSSGPGKLPAFGSDLEQQQQLRNVLKGTDYFGINFHLGYELAGAGVNVDFRYLHTLTDHVRTGANAYNFIENKNIQTAFQVTLGWDFLSSYPKKRVLILRNPRS